MRKLQSLEVLRAIAALLVVMFHVGVIMPERMGGVAPFGDAFAAGNRGVDLFFVLSGFIIATVHAADIGRPSRLPNYVFKRLSRIYPAVWIMSAFAIALYASSFGGSAKADKLAPWSVVASVFLLPQRGDALVNVTWTLKYEIFFYALFAVAIASRRLGFVLIGLWQAATVAAWALGGMDTLGAFYLRSICLEFGVGLACAWWLQRPGRSESHLTCAALLLAGMLAFVLGVVLDKTVSWSGLACTLGTGAAIIGFVRLEQLESIQVPRVLVAAGGASYAIYIVHFSAITLLATVLAKLQVSASNIIALVLAAGGVAAGFLFDGLVDQAIQRWLRGRWLSVERKPVKIGSN